MTSFPSTVLPLVPSVSTSIGTNPNPFAATGSATAAPASIPGFGATATSFPSFGNAAPSANQSLTQSLLNPPTASTEQNESESNITFPGFDNSSTIATGLASGFPADRTMQEAQLNETSKSIATLTKRARELYSRGINPYIDSLDNFPHSSYDQYHAKRDLAKPLPSLNNTLVTPLHPTRSTPLYSPRSSTHLLFGTPHSSNGTLIGEKRHGTFIQQDAAQRRFPFVGLQPNLVHHSGGRNALVTTGQQPLSTYLEGINKGGEPLLSDSDARLRAMEAGVHRLSTAANQYAAGEFPSKQLKIFEQSSPTGRVFDTTPSPSQSDTYKGVVPLSVQQAVNDSKHDWSVAELLEEAEGEVMDKDNFDDLARVDYEEATREDVVVSAQWRDSQKSIANLVGITTLPSTYDPKTSLQTRPIPLTATAHARPLRPTEGPEATASLVTHPGAKSRHIAWNLHSLDTNNFATAASTQITGPLLHEQVLFSSSPNASQSLNPDTLPLVYSLLQIVHTNPVTQWPLNFHHAVRKYWHSTERETEKPKHPTSSENTGVFRGHTLPHSALSKYDVLWDYAVTLTESLRTRSQGHFSRSSPSPHPLQLVAASRHTLEYQYRSQLISTVYDQRQQKSSSHTSASRYFFHESAMQCPASSFVQLICEFLTPSGITGSITPSTDHDGSLMSRDVYDPLDELDQLHRQHQDPPLLDAYNLSETEAWSALYCALRSGHWEAAEWIAARSLPPEVTHAVRLIHQTPLLERCRFSTKISHTLNTTNASPQEELEQRQQEQHKFLQELFADEACRAHPARAASLLLLLAGDVVMNSSSHIFAQRDHLCELAMTETLRGSANSVFDLLWLRLGCIRYSSPGDIIGANAEELEEDSEISQSSVHRDRLSVQCFSKFQTFVHSRRQSFMSVFQSPGSAAAFLLGALLPATAIRLVLGHLQSQQDAVELIHLLLVLEQTGLVSLSAGNTSQTDVEGRTTGQQRHSLQNLSSYQNDSQRKPIGLASSVTPTRTLIQTPQRNTLRRSTGLLEGSPLAQLLEPSHQLKQSPSSLVTRSTALANGKRLRSPTFHALPQANITDASHGSMVPINVDELSLGEFPLQSLSNYLLLLSNTTNALSSNPLKTITEESSDSPNLSSSFLLYYFTQRDDLCSLCHFAFKHPQSFQQILFPQTHTSPETVNTNLIQNKRVRETRWTPSRSLLGNNSSPLNSYWMESVATQLVTTTSTIAATNTLGHPSCLTKLTHSNNNDHYPQLTLENDQLVDQRVCLARRLILASLVQSLTSVETKGVDRSIALWQWATELWMDQSLQTMGKAFQSPPTLQHNDDHLSMSLRVLEQDVQQLLDLSCQLPTTTIMPMGNVSSHFLKKALPSLLTLLQCAQSFHRGEFARVLSQWLTLPWTPTMSPSVTTSQQIQQCIMSTTTADIRRVFPMALLAVLQSIDIVLKKDVTNQGSSSFIHSSSRRDLMDLAQQLASWFECLEVDLTGEWTRRILKMVENITQQS